MKAVSSYKDIQAMDHAIKGTYRHSWLEDTNLLWVDLSIIKISPDTKQGREYVTFKKLFITYGQSSKCINVLQINLPLKSSHSTYLFLAKITSSDSIQQSIQTCESGIPHPQSGSILLFQPFLLCLLDTGHPLSLN